MIYQSVHIKSHMIISLKGWSWESFRHDSRNLHARILLFMCLKAIFFSVLLITSCHFWWRFLVQNEKDLIFKLKILQTFHNVITYWHETSAFFQMVKILRFEKLQPCNYCCSKNFGVIVWISSSNFSLLLLPSSLQML